MGQPGAPASGGGLLGEIRDAVTLRAFLLVCGVALLQLGFIASYLGAFHRHVPHRVPVGVVAPAAAMPSVLRGLNSLPGGPLRATAARSVAAGVSGLRSRDSYGVLVVSAAPGTDRLIEASASGPSAADAVTAVVRAADARANRRVAVDDIRPPASGDHNGLSSFYLVIGWIVGGYLVAAILGISAGSRPENLTRATVRLAAVAVYAAVTGLAGALIAGPWLGALPSHVPGLWALGTLLVFAAGAFTMALMVIAGTIGIGLTIAVFVVLGNPSAGGAYAWPLLPAFWRVIGRWLPNGAGTDAVRAITYFGAASITTDVLVIAAYAAAGVAATYLVLALAGRQLADLPGARPAPIGPGG
jgi:hypothetical protein